MAVSEAANETRFKSLDRLVRDPRIVKVWDEGEDGLWAEIVDGYNWDGCSCLHEYTCSDLLSKLGRITAGPTY